MTTDSSSESRWLDSIIAIINTKISELSDQLEDKRAEIIASKQFLWNNQAEMDSAEVASTKQEISLDIQTYEDRARLLARLKRQRNSPYFGRVDFMEAGHTQQNRIYTGIFTLTALNNVDILVYDWRAPIASMYYDHEKGPAQYESPDGIIKGEIILKRQYKIDNGTLRYMFDTDLTIDDEILQEVLGSHTGKRMKNIVQTIQKEQNRAIRNEQSSVLVVDGVAGSGKTSVALHRAAYLLYKYRDTIKSDNILILSPNNIFSEYISNVLPELGEENILQTTFEGYAESAFGRRFESRGHYFEDIFAHHKLPRIRTESIRLKTSHLFLSVLTDYATHIGERVFTERSLEISRKGSLSKEQVKPMYSGYRDMLPISKRFELLKKRIAFKTGTSSRSAIKEINAKVDEMFSNLNALEWYRRLFKNSAYLAHLSAKHGYDAALLEKISLFTSESLAKRNILYEDVAPILLLKGLLEGFPNSESIKHLIVDEVQDYSPIHLEIIKNVFSRANMTLLGDGNQSLNPYRESSIFERIGSIFQDKSHQLIKLAKSYRSTYEITSFANRIIGLKNEEDIVQRHGELPMLANIDPNNRKQDILQIINDLKAQGFGNSTAILCKTLREVDELLDVLGPEGNMTVLRDDTSEYRPGLILSPIYLAKGLEFDAVIVYNASDRNYHDESEKSLLYIACTRALHRLVATYEDTITGLLPFEA